MKVSKKHWLTVIGLATLAGAADHASAIIVPVTGVNGRFIKVTNLNPISRSLAIGEVEVFNFGTTPNVVSNLSSNDITATFEIDGAASGYVLNHGTTPAPVNNVRETGGATYNASGVGNFYTLDLGSTQNIGTVKIWQRNDGCCQDRLTDFKVEVLADNAGLPGASQFSQEYARPATNSFGQINVVGGREIRVADNGTIGTEVLGSAGGRFIGVKNNGAANRALAIGEIEAFLAGVVPAGSYDNANDVALASKGATWESESGAFFHGFGGSALDGAPTSGAETFNRSGVGAELVVDLGQIRDVGTIRVWQRQDCCWDRLQNFTVTLYDDNGSGAPGAVLNSQSFAGQPANSSFASFALPAFSNTQFTVEATDTVVIEIDPLNFTADLLKIGVLGNGALTLKPGASLVLNVLNTPTGTQTFDVLDFGSVAGSFSNITINGNGKFDLSQLLVTGQITISVPEPTTTALGLLGLTGLMLRRRRLA